MAEIFIKATHHDPGSSDLTGVNFTVKFDHATTLVSVQEMPPLSFEDRLVAYQTIVERLARALLAAAQNPQGITENPELPG